jgi:hypothetical protein
MITEWWPRLAILTTSLAHNDAESVCRHVQLHLFDRQPGERVAYSESSDVHSIGILINENAMRYAETLL